MSRIRLSLRCVGVRLFVGSSGNPAGHSANGRTLRSHGDRQYKIRETSGRKAMWRFHLEVFSFSSTWLLFSDSLEVRKEPHHLLLDIHMSELWPRTMRSHRLNQMNCWAHDYFSGVFGEEWGLVSSRILMQVRNRPISTASRIWFTSRLRITDRRSESWTTQRRAEACKMACFSLLQI